VRILLDTDIVLDVLLAREPRLADARLLWQANDEGRLNAYLTATTVTDIFYIARRLTNHDQARAAVQVCLDAFEIVSVSRSSLERAQALSGADFEDNVQIAGAESIGLEAIVTRDTGRFAGTTVAVWSPAECRRRLDRASSGS
jgi:predicted nucleic acid-binding protein